MHFLLSNISFSESKFFEDFDDDFEDDYTGSIKLIKDLEKMLYSEYKANIQSEEQCSGKPNDLECIKESLEGQRDSHSTSLTRPINYQQQHNADILVEKDKNQISFEVLMEDDKNETNDEVEYFLASSDYNPNDTDAESSKSDTFAADSSNPSCYEVSDQANADSNELEESKQNIGIFNIQLKANLSFIASSIYSICRIFG